MLNNLVFNYIFADTVSKYENMTIELLEVIMFFCFLTKIQLKIITISINAIKMEN